MEQQTNHTPEGRWSSLLNPVLSVDKSVGPAISLMVSPGDTVRAKVYGMYTGETGGNTNVLPLISSIVATAFSYGHALEGVSVSSYFEELLTGLGIIPAQPANSDAPKSYIKYFVFDRQMVMQQTGHLMLSEAALNNWEKLELEIPIQTNGYIYLYACPPKQSAGVACPPFWSVRSLGGWPMRASPM